MQHHLAKAPGARGKFILGFLGLFIILAKSNASEIIQIDATQCVANENPRLKISECAAFLNITNIEQKQFHLLQKVERKIIPGIRCHLRTSTHYWYCGRYSHIHLAAPALVEIPNLVTYEDCYTMSKTKIFNFEGKSVSVYEHQMSYTRFLVNGTLTYPNDLLNGIDPACEGNGVNINGIFIPGTFEEKQIGVQAEPVELLQTKAGCYLGSHWVGNNCLDHNLRLGYDRIISDDKTDSAQKFTSPWRTVDIFNISLFTFEGEQGTQKYLVIDPQITLALELKDKKHFESLIPELFYYKTNIDNLMVWFTNAIKPYFPLLNAKEKDDMLPLEIFYSYQQYNKLIVPETRCLQNHFLSKSSIQTHRKKLVRALGELDLVIQCDSLKINVSLGENLPCFVDHFSVSINNKTMGISPFSRRLVNTTHLTPTKCSENPIFLHLYQGKFLGNQGQGMQILNVNQYLMDKPISLFLYHSWQSLEKTNFSESAEELYLSQLAADSNNFEVKITDSWFIQTYHKVVDFLSSTWYHIVLVVAAILTGIGSLLCVAFIIYILACTKIHAYKEGGTSETHELRDFTNNGEN